MFDGSLTIDTELNTKAFDQGVKSLVSGLKGLALTATTVILGILGIQSVKSLAVLSAEFGRLKQAAQAIGQMYGFSAEEARKLIDSLVAQGVQTDVASRAYINFVKEGLDANLLPGLARGAQNLNALAESGESSSDVLNGLLGGILTLNTQVLRNRGVVVDLTSAYKNYAATMGLAAGQLTVTEQRQALLIAVTEKLKGVTGLYELSQRTAAGQMSSNIRLMNEFKNVLGGALQDAFFNLIKSFNDVIKGFTIAFKEGGRLYSVWLALASVATLLSRAIRAVFETLARWLGIQPSQTKAVTDSTVGLGGMADSADAAATAEGKLGGAIEKAAKKAKGALAAFDSLNVLQQSNADAADAGGGGGGSSAGDLGGALGGLGSVDLSQIEDPLLKIQAAADKLWARLTTLFEPLWENVIRPLSDWVQNDVLPAFLDLLGQSGDTLKTALIALEPLWTWFWDNVLVPLATWIGGKLVEYLQWVTDNLKNMEEWIKNNKTAFQALAVILGVILIALLILVSPLAQFIAILIVIGVVVGGLIALWPILLKAVKDTWARILETISPFLDWFKKLINSVKEFWTSIWNTMWAILQNIALLLWLGFKSIFIDPLTELLAKFGLTWSDVWEGLKNGFGKIMDSLSEKFRKGFEAFKPIAKGVVNSIIDILNSLHAGFIKTINGLIKGANTLGGKIKGWSVIPSIAPLQIPHLAMGAVIPPNSAFAAILGDQRSGTNIEAPADLIRQIVREEIGSVKADVTINFAGSLAGLVRELKPFIDKENVRIGNSLLKGAV